MVTIRRATGADILKVSRLWLLMVRELAPSYTPRVDWWRRMAAEAMKSGGYFVEVAEKGQTLVGFLDCIIFPEPSTGRIHAIGQHFFVLPEYRETGVAGRLYRRMKETARAMKATTHEMFAFDTERPMWAKKGYTPIRTLMRKEITSCLMPVPQ